MPGTCVACRLPPELHREVVSAHRRGATLRALSATLAIKGHPVSKDSLNRHLTRCIAPVSDLDPTDPLLLAFVVRNELRGWHGLANKVAVALAEIGAIQEAEIVQSVVYDKAKTALEMVPREHFVGSMLEAEALAFAFRRLVVGPGGEELLARLVPELRDLGGDSLADAYQEVATKAKAPIDSPAGRAEPSQVLGCPAGPKIEGAARP